MFLPVAAKAVARWIASVVFPTPPFCAMRATVFILISSLCPMHSRDCAHVRDCVGTYAHTRADAQARKRAYAGVHRCTAAQVSEPLLR